MKKFFKLPMWDNFRHGSRYIPIILVITAIFSGTVFGFTNGGWLNIVGFEQRQDYIIDKGELTEYLVSFYFEISDSGETKTEVVNYYKNMLKDSTTNKFEKSQNITAIELLNVIYNTVSKSVSLEPVEEEIMYTGRDGNTDDVSVQFALSRELITWDEDGCINLNKALTLGEAVALLNRAKQAAPGFEITVTNEDYYKFMNPIPVAVIVEPEKIDVPAESETLEENEINVSETTQGKKAYLTFDDGVSENTIKILEILNEYNIKASFFITGDKYPEVIKEIDAGGHTIGNHSYTHDYSIIYQSSEAFFEDILKEEEFLESILGYKPTLMRFPGGSNNTVSNKYSENLMPQLVYNVTQAGYIYIDWNATALDATGKKSSKEDVINAIKETTKNKDNVVILMHQTKEKVATVEALPEIIEYLLSEGYEILPLDEASYRPQFCKVP